MIPITFYVPTKTDDETFQELSVHAWPQIPTAGVDIILDDEYYKVVSVRWHNKIRDENKSAILGADVFLNYLK